MIIDEIRRRMQRVYSELVRHDDDGRRTPRRTLFAWAGTIIVSLLVAISLLNYDQLGDHARTITKTMHLEAWDKSKYNLELDAASKGVEVWDSLSVLKGSPTVRFRDNLKSNTRYVTTWPSAGWTNDVMTFINLIYFGIISDRVPIVPAFPPTHVAWQSSQQIRDVPFGEVFDVPRLAKALERPVLEWREVKDLSNNTTSELETIGCWNIWEATQYDEHYARRAPNTLAELKLDISYMTAPDFVKLIPNVPTDKHAKYGPLLALSFPQLRKQVLIEPKESPIKKEKLFPDEHLMCVDYMYYFCEVQMYEFTTDYSPAWRRVGQYMHWKPRLIELADQYVREALGTQAHDATPEYISVHVRHGDFGTWCGSVPLDECFAPVKAIARRVEEVRSELQTRLGIYNTQVIVTSDEKDAKWWQEVENLGYKRLDHHDTVKNYGKWYPVFIDAVVQSSGIGFVGTHKSTMSLMAKLRVQAWRNGVTRTFKWGTVGADDHEEDDQEVIG